MCGCVCVCELQISGMLFCMRGAFSVDLLMTPRNLTHLSIAPDLFLICKNSPNAKNTMLTLIADWCRFIIYIWKWAPIIKRHITASDVGGGDRTALQFGYAVAPCNSSLHCPHPCKGTQLTGSIHSWGIMAPSEAWKGDIGFKMLEAPRRKAGVKHWIAPLTHAPRWQDILGKQLHVK